ncbi:MAG: SEC-C metal-binding domain-containing protein [Bacteroidales bacterium]|jgi:hypothetical protein
MVYQILIVLDRITPKIWRRVLVDPDTLLFDFHIVIQIAMGWENCHLHHFIKDGKYYSERMPNDNFWDEELNVDYSGMKIGDLLKKEGDAIIYEYDFGDSWIHTLTLEAVLPSANSANSANTTQIPSCIAGQMACPDEDSGGPFLYKPSRSKGKTNIDLEAINSFLRDDEFGFGDEFEDEEENFTGSVAEDTYKNILLNTKTKAQIIDVAHIFGMKIKTSANKETCATFIEQELRQNPLLLRNTLSYNELKALYVLFNESQNPPPCRGGGQSRGERGGSAPAGGPDSAKARLPEEDESQGFSIDDLEVPLMLGLLGVSFDRKEDAPKFYLPNNLNESLLPQLQMDVQDQALKKAYHIENLLIGMLTLYGALPLRKIEELLNLYLPEAVPLTDLLDYFKSNRLLRKYNATNSAKDLLFLYYKGIPDIKPLVAEIDKRKDLEYAIFKESELLEASEQVYYFKNSFSQRLLRQLNKFDIPDTEIFMHEIWVNTQIETSTHSILEFLSKRLEFDNFQDLQDTVKLLIDYQNNIPKWTLKGNVPADLSKTNGEAGGFGGAGRPASSHFPVFTKQPGRNDPCPCGSGKKFKNCCGNN